MDNGAVCYRRFLEGDEDAIVDIIADYREGLVLFINSFVDNICIAEEIAEDIFVKIYDKRPKFSGKSSFKTWIYAIGKKAAFSSIKKMKRHPKVPTSDLYYVTDEENIERNHIRSEQKLQLLRALSKLNPDYRRVLYLVFIEGFTNQETAKIMGKTERQIRNLLYRAKGSLKKILEEEGFEYEEI